MLILMYYSCSEESFHRSIETNIIQWQVSLQKDVVRLTTRALTAEGQLRRMQKEAFHAAEVASLRERDFQGQVLHMRKYI